MLQFNPRQANGDLTAVNAKYFVLAHFTRHIRPGMAILGTSRPDTIAAFDVQQSKLVLVTSNFGKGRWVTHDLSRFSTVPKGDPSAVKRWRTEASDPEGDRYAEVGAADGLDGEEQDTRSTRSSIEEPLASHFHAPVVGAGSRLVIWFGVNTTQTIEILGIGL